VLVRIILFFDIFGLKSYISGRKKTRNDGHVSFHCRTNITQVVNSLQYCHCINFLPTIRGHFKGLQFCINERYPDNLQADQVTAEYLEFLKHSAHEEVDECLYAQ
jgi:hypothetical protein